MMTPLNDLTIVSITFNNPGIHKTIESLRPLLECGAKVLIQNGGKPITIEAQNLTIYNEEDNGIYDGLNKGIKKVDTAYFMLLHAGDTFIGSADDLSIIIDDLHNQTKHLSLNSQLIGKRFHSSRFWKPWMLAFGTQPPHLPCVYRSSKYKSHKYNTAIPVIADFNLFYQQDMWDSYINHKKLLVQMEPGGKTSGGFGSFILVSKHFVIHYGIRGLIMATCRFPLKLLQTFL